MNRHRLSSFTLFELLVTITIIAVLTSFLLPALRSAREKANRIACLNNERQIAIALIVYSGENDGYLPTQATWVFPYTDWSARLTNLLSRTWVTNNCATVFKCPSDNNRRNTVAPSFNWKYFWRSYAVNGTNAWCAGYKVPWPSILGRPVKLSEVPLHVVLIGENHGIDGSTAPGMSGAYVEVSEMENLQGHASANHRDTRRGAVASTTDENGGGNYCYADGRVEFHYRSQYANPNPAFDGGPNDPWKWR